MRVSGVKANEWPVFICAKPCGSPKHPLGRAFFSPRNKLAESRGVDNKVRLPQLEISRRVLDAALLAHSLFLSPSPTPSPFYHC